MNAFDVLDLMCIVEDLKDRSSKGFIPFSSVTIDNKLEFSDYIIFNDNSPSQADDFFIVADMVVDEIHHDVVSYEELPDGLFAIVRRDEEDGSYYIEISSIDSDGVFIIENGEFYRA